MGKYHINLKGEVAICRAIEHCPLGGAHFDHQAKAIEYADRMNEAVINSNLPEDLARMEYIESDIHKHKYIHINVIEETPYFNEVRNRFLSLNF